MKKRAFTLAEVLITIVTLGILAVMVLPSFHSGINDKVYENSKKVFKGKFKEALHRMRVDGALAKRYDTTREFVDTLSKYIRIGQICDNTDLVSCFPSEVNASKNAILYDTTQLKTTDNLGATFTADLVGMAFGDGTKAIIGYNPTCRIMSTYDVNANVTECLVMIYDVNAKQDPNTIDYDMATINLNNDADDDDEIEIGEVFTPRSYTYNECIDAVNKGAPIKACKSDDDYWAYSVDKCFKQGKRLPTRLELKEIANKLYGETVSLSGNTEGLTIADNSIWSDLGGANAYFWSADEYGATVSYYRYFSVSSTYGRNDTRNHSNFKAFCLGD